MTERLGDGSQTGALRFNSTPSLNCELYLNSRTITEIFQKSLPYELKFNANLHNVTRACDAEDSRRFALGEREKMERIESNAPIAVLIASLNEEKGIGPTIEDIQKALGRHRCLVVDGNSVDRTVEIAKEMGADILLQKGEGKGSAICQGIEKLDSERYVVFIDADFTYPAEYIPKMIEVLEHNPNVGMVIGNRFSRRFYLKEAMDDLFYVGNRLIAFAQYLVNGIKLRDPLSGLRVVRSEILKGWKPKSKGFDVEAEMNYRVEFEGYEITEIPIRYRRRMGQKKLKPSHAFSILKRILTESFYASA